MRLVINLFILLQLLLLVCTTYGCYYVEIVDYYSLLKQKQYLKHANLHLYVNEM